MTNIKPLFYILTYLLIIVLHEAGHAIVAKILKYKVDTIFLTPFYATCEFEEPYYAFELQLIASAGIAVQIIILLFAIIIITFFNTYIDLVFLDILKVVCVGFNSTLILLNLLPLDPLDGYHIWKFHINFIQTLKNVRPIKSKLIKQKPKTEMEILIAEITKKMKE